MKISVITACYNSIATIDDLLSSVGSQCYSDVEHIVIDGASSDGTAQVVAATSQRIAKFITEPDRGIYDAMNKGLRCSTGDIVGFLNADDMFADQGTAASIVRAFQEYPSAAVVYGDLEYVSADRHMRTIRYWRSGEFERSKLSWGWMPPHPTFYVRRSLLEAVGEFDTRYRIASDYDLILRCLTSSGVTACYLPQVLVRMRVGGVSNASLRTKARKSMEDLRIMRSHGIGGIWSLAAKNLRKVPQFLERSVQSMHSSG